MSRWSTWVLMWRIPKREIWSKPSSLPAQHETTCFPRSICRIYFITKHLPVLGFNCTMYTTYLAPPPASYFCNLFYLFIFLVRIQRLVNVPLWDINSDIWSRAWTDRWLASSILSHPSAPLLTARWHSVTPARSGELIAFTPFRHSSKNAADGPRSAGATSKPETLWSPC